MNIPLRSALRTGAIALIFGGAHLIAAPETYYVSTNGNDNTHNGKSLANAFETLGKAFSVVNPGDTILMEGGTYSENAKLTRGGTTTGSAIITIEPLPSTGEVIMQDPSLANNSQTGAIEIRNCGYVTIRGLSFKGFHHGRGIMLLNSESFHSLPEGKYTSNITIEDCLFEDIGVRDPLGSLGGGLKGSCVFAKNAGPNIIVQNCDFKDTYGESVHFKQTFDCIIRENTFEGLKPQLNPGLSDLTATPRKLRYYASAVRVGGGSLTHVEDELGQDNLILSNIVHDLDFSESTDYGGESPTPDAKDSAIGLWDDVDGLRNIFQDNRIFNFLDGSAKKGIGIKIEAGIDSDEVINNIVDNVKFGYNTDGHETTDRRTKNVTWDGNIAYNCEVGFTFKMSENNTVRNNISFNNDLAPVHVYTYTVNYGGNTFHNNCWKKAGDSLVAAWNTNSKTPNTNLSAWNAISGGTNSVTDDISKNPNFKSASGGNFNLRIDSNCEDMGKDALGATIDMGAYPNGSYTLSEAKATNLYLGTINNGERSDMAKDSADDTYMVLKEVEDSNKSKLQGWYRFDVAAGTETQLWIEANYVNMGEGDTFKIEYSIDLGSTWHYIGDVTRPNDQDETDVYALPFTSAENTRIRFIDNDRTSGNTALDRLKIDRLYLTSYIDQ